MNKALIKLLLCVFTTIISMFFFIKNKEIGLTSIIIFIIYLLSSIPIFLIYKLNKIKWKLIFMSIFVIFFIGLIFINTSKGGFICDINIENSFNNIEGIYNNNCYEYQFISISWDAVLEFNYYILLFTLLLISFSDYISDKKDGVDKLFSIVFMMCIIIYLNSLFNPNLLHKTYNLSYNYMTQNYLIFIVMFISLIIYKCINKKELCKSTS